MRLDYYYNFRNPVRHFIGIDNLDYPSDIETFIPVDELCWTVPFPFRVYKAEDKYRTVKIPNILNFVRAYHYYKGLPCFDDVNSLDPIHKRLAANLETGDFVSGNYNSQLDEDFLLLCNYDVLVKLDISEYYGRIYTHYLDLDKSNLQDNSLAWLNNGRTSGLLMGNYLSLYFAEYLSSLISKDLQEYIDSEDVNCVFKYFSDDFYFFCNESDVQKVLENFDRTLAKYDFVRKDKQETWTYETYNVYNLLTRYWKATIRSWNLDVLKDFENSGKHPETRLYHKFSFLNQLVYRVSSLQDEKTKRSFIVNFFKTKHFQTCDFSKYKLYPYDLHQLFFLIKLSPESLLYISNFLASIKEIQEDSNTKAFMKARYFEALKKELHDEQLYYYYAISVLNYSEIIKESTSLVMQSQNQVLIAYYIKNAEFSDKQISSLMAINGEEYWFQNYHLILFNDSLKSDLEGSIKKYLIPKRLFDKPNQTKEDRYLKFYFSNLDKGNELINDIDKVAENISAYLELRNKETEVDFSNDESEISDEEIDSVDELPFIDKSSSVDIVLI